ncbi:hypothetical protein IQ255_01990 [Pleurocapsales cyanobacterium LEGE 10410]|nr:hypothetical protein [Pleurocapsales cyanobacterium LEGE 10410]
MNNESDFFAELKFAQYYQLNSIPETILLMEAEHSMTSAKTTVESKASERAVIFGLGMISTLLLLSGIQLQRSVNIIPDTIETTQTSRKSNSTPNISFRKFSQQNHQKLGLSKRTIETFAIKNSISQGKF